MVNTGTGLTGGPITSTGTISISNTGVIAGLYTNPGIFINAQGQIMTASSGPTPILSVTGVSPISSSGGTNPSISLLDTAVTPSTYSYPTITVDQKGRITNASSNTPVLSVSGTSGNISSTGGQNPVLDLIPTGVTANSYTNMNATVDVNGWIVAASNGSAGSSTPDLSQSFVLSTPYTSATPFIFSLITNTDLDGSGWYITTIIDGTNILTITYRLIVN